MAGGAGILFASVKNGIFFFFGVYTLMKISVNVFQPLSLLTLWQSPYLYDVACWRFPWMSSADDQNDLFLIV